ncbi:polysaccharide biosynthesis protein [Morganella morganii]|uniref:Polysaccharide biosynthesis protein n=1 Tax=Morganella morganii TaxID=582 RepID=A0A8I0PTF2_MORMO|nr:polysaccharide biosynthesis protein [Morganella morganii]MBT0403341.1 polysaccharide biosynthesis protein [Morganella morganii subsp. morganii]RTY31250.1 polysaccharide biosynthesis protein [Morganella morganii subsp. morganii]HEI8863939.1 polysaccharide biosynthesis protein [Morganella morganii]
MYANKNRFIKFIILIFIDVSIMLSSYWVSMWLRLDRDIPISSFIHWASICSTIPITVFILVKIGFYRAILRYVNMSIVKWAVVGSFLSSLLLIAFSLYQDAFLPRTVPIIYFFLLVILLCGTRYFYRNIVNLITPKGLPVAIYGAGESGRQLLTILREHKEYNPIFFIDDKKKLQYHTIHGLKVYPSDNLAKLIDKYNISKILLAIPSVSSDKRKNILKKLEPLHREVLTIPDFNELVDGTAQIGHLNKVSISDLLGREQVAPINELLKKNIFEKNIFISGAGGSIGSELCRQILSQGPNLIILYEISEFSLYSIDRELNRLKYSKKLNTTIIPILGDVKNKEKIDFIIKKFSIHTIYHAAAYKHVPLVEYNMVEGIQNNILGTLSLAQSASENNVERFVLISTDKAVRPTNTMGATKRFAELILQALALTPSETHFSMVRFGNVLGSSGSVVPLFEKQIANGGPITLTHKDITRFFMTIPEAAQLVIQAGAMGKNGDVFVLDMGESVRIYDLAEKMINLSGFTIKDEKNPNGDIEIKVTGLRPGEKLYEELLIGDNVQGTFHPRIMTANEKYLTWNELSQLIAEIKIHCEQRNLAALRELLLKAPLDFHPRDEICDLLK